jgi:ferredoxin-nitrate reductase
MDGIGPHRIADIWGTRTPFGREEDWPSRVDTMLADGISEDEVERWVQSACVLCSNGCALDIAVANGRIVGVRGREVDRINHGRLGPKGLYGWQANNSPDRLREPLIRRNGALQGASWDEAFDLVVARSSHVLEESGPLALAFYTTGQLFLEDYYTLGLVVRGGIGTPHLDGNTRLCTATADFALKETFGSDGQPGSYTDFDECDTLFMVGHNVAETQTVLWARLLDRLQGPDRPKLVVVDPRPTPSALEADVHLPIKNGTNLALLNGIQHELFKRGWIDETFLASHTVGLDKVRQTVSEYPPERVAEICDVEADNIRRAAEIIGRAERLVSTCLQGVYQSHQATASACQVNNINLLRGMIGKPGCAPFQLNGQPTAQNTREAGADGDPAGMRNWQNRAHMDDLARHWNVDPLVIPSWGPPTHVMQILRLCEEGSIKFLWITGTNPAVSLPELSRIRSILGQERLFVVVTDAFLTETAQLADVVFPAAIWGEKLGTFTNQDRTVHISEKAVDPPGQAKTDMEIFIEYAKRLGLEDKDGAPLIKWSTPEECFDAFKEMTRGRPCDYSGLTYDKLRGGSGIQWPCTSSAPEGTERLYIDHAFNTDTEYAEDWGHDLMTGATQEKKHYSELDPAGRAILKAAHYTEPFEPIREEFPFLLITGRTVYHWHTRTKTGRVRELDRAAPEPWVELAKGDADELGIGEGDWVRVTSPRGVVEAKARVSGIRPGVVFIPFHYGYWDSAEGDEPNGRPRAANELTITAWDPVSKQPIFKTAAVRVERIEAGDGAALAPEQAASAPLGARA